MWKTLLALGAAMVFAAGPIAAPTPSQADGAVVVASVVGAALATCFVVHAVAHPAYAAKSRSKNLLSRMNRM